METRTVSINHEHDQIEVKESAQLAITELEKQGVKFLPMKPIENAGVFSKVMKANKHEYRYTRQFDIDTGIIKSRIDIDYEKPGASQ